MWKPIFNAAAVHLVLTVLLYSWATLNPLGQCCQKSHNSNSSCSLIKHIHWEKCEQFSTPKLQQNERSSTEGELLYLAITSCSIQSSQMKPRQIGWDCKRSADDKNIILSSSLSLPDRRQQWVLNSFLCISWHSGSSWLSNQGCAGILM